MRLLEALNSSSFRVAKKSPGNIKLLFAEKIIFMLLEKQYLNSRTVLKLFDYTNWRHMIEDF